ncbi:MAG TPA: response regulator [Roseiflexaceae bacterium]|nr:response regulator [Roseiflexaceae bacterium]
MTALPRAARAYVIAIWLAAAGLLVGTLSRYPLHLEHLQLLALWLPLYVVADYFEVEIALDERPSVLMSVADAPTIFLMAIGGAPCVVGMAIGSALADSLQRRPWYKVLFNASQRSITYLVALLIYRSIYPTDVVPFSGLRGILALIAVSVIYYTCNTLFVSTVIALASRQKLLRVYGASFRLVQWVHFITLPLGGVLAALWKIDHWLILPGIVPLIMAQRSFKALGAWQAEGRRSKALADESRQLAGKLERLQDTATAMIASLEPLPLLETVSTRLALLLDASASWVVLLDDPVPQLVATRGAPRPRQQLAAIYAAELDGQTVRQLDASDLARLEGAGASPWQTLVIIPLALETRLLGGICLASERQIAIAEDDRRVLLAFAAQAALAVEHARLFEELRHKQDELVRSSKLAALGTFSAGIAHEFNNLLAGVLGYAQLGLLSDNIEEKNEALSVAARACLRGRGITSGLLTFARRNDPQRALHQIRDAVDETLALVERELAKLNIRVERNLQPVPLTICDLGQIGQVLLNLITNARDAMMDQGGGVITIELAQRGAQIELAVSDTGSGIPDHLLQQIFQPFMTTKGALGGSTTPGTGLGLAISYGIVESHGGTISAASAVGRGTTMTVRLPIIAELPRPVLADGSASQVSALRILVVDDEPVVAESLARLLSEYGHQVVLATDGESGLRRYREQPFDLVITDAVMPVMDGAEFVARLRALDPHAHVMAISGQTAAPLVDRMLQAGAFGFVSKPFVVDELLGAIARGMRERMLSAA